MEPTATQKISVVIVARYASVRAGLHALLAADSTLCLQGDTPDGDALAPLLSALHPEVVLLETLGGGPEELSRTLTALNRATANAAALVVLGDAPERDLGRLSRAGLPGWAYLPREAEAGQIVRAVQGAAAGLIVLDAALPLTSSFVAGNDSALESEESLLPGEALTPRETEVLQLMAEGLPNKIIATRLGISLHTAKFHVAQILGKLDAESRTEAVTIGARRGYVVL